MRPTEGEFAVSGFSSEATMLINRFLVGGIPCRSRRIIGSCVFHLIPFRHNHVYYNGSFRAVQDDALHFYWAFINVSNLIRL